MTNDDGVFADGIKSLRDALKDDCNVYVLAPDSNRSGVSSHISMYRTLSVKKIGSGVYSCDGYPADCVISAVESNLFRGVDFDCVLSGINRGANMGTDCVYSGTFAAARQAVLYKIPGIALSVSEDKDGKFIYDGLASFVRKNLDTLISLFSRGEVLNINAPSKEKIDAAFFTVPCIRDYNDSVNVLECGEDGYSARFVGGEIRSFGESENEYKTVANGDIAVTRLLAEPAFSVFDGDSSVEFKF